MTPKQKDKVVQGYLFRSDDDPRDRNICQIVGRCDAEGSLLEQGPMFSVKFGDGSTGTAAGYELQPWFPT
jgi:hypothetical protein